MLTITPLPAFQDNYIWMLHTDRHAIAIDPGDAAPVQAFIECRRLTLVAILITHHHHDHTGGNLDLQQGSRCAIYGPDNSRIPGITDIVRAPDTLDFPALDLHFTVIDTPGHTLDHISYYGAKHLFCGDTVFGCGCGKLFEGTPAIMAHSLDKIIAMPESTLLCCAHEYTLSNIAFALTIDGENRALLARAAADRAKRALQQPTLPSTLALEKHTNPFLRFHDADMLAFARAYLRRAPRNPGEAFGAIRAAKDAWDNA